MKTRVVWIVAVSLIVIPIAVVVWAVTSPRREPSVRERPRFDRYERAWSSAMAKAGVEATFPPEPVPLRQLRVVGQQSLEATFTAEEIAALLSVYSFESRAAGRTFGTCDVSIRLSPEGVIDLENR